MLRDIWPREAYQVRWLSRNDVFCSLFFRVLYRIEERLRDIGSGNLVTRMNELSFVQHDLTELEDECVEVAEIFGVKPCAL